MVVKCQGILHWKLRTFDFVLNIYSRLVAVVYFWGESNWALNTFIHVGKQEAIEHVRKGTGMLIDTPTSGGGNTNTGVMAERFLDPDVRDTICEIIPNSTDRQNFSQLLRDLNVMETPRSLEIWV